MDKYNDLEIQQQIHKVISWKNEGGLWGKIHEANGNANPGSCGYNKILGYILPRSMTYEENIKLNEVVVVYKHSSSSSFDENQLQLSYLTVSDWEKYMRRHNS
ncbi:hypothetical protein [Proteus penneri]|uniref:hypothetical protein n=1 Tax=Proteus penneri TaxID=102862 RepID=UPI00288B078F|nr:hypothetical protein [Proteus penneri]